MLNLLKFIFFLTVTIYFNDGSFQKFDLGIGWNESSYCASGLFNSSCNDNDMVYNIYDHRDNVFVSIPIKNVKYITLQD